MAKNNEVEDKPKENIEGEEKKSANKGSRKKIILLGSILILVILIIVMGLFWFVYLKDTDTVEKEDADLSTASQNQTKAIRFEDIVRLDEIEVVIEDMDREKKLIMGISLKLESSTGKNELLQKNYQIQKNITILLKNKTLKELSETEGKMQLRYELTRLINNFLEKGHVITLYFYNFLIMKAS